MIGGPMKTVIFALMTVFMICGASFEAQAQKKSTRKVQEVNFGEMNLKGTVRNPDGAYLVQKRGIKFMPLYEVQKDLDGKIRESSMYLRY